MWDRRRSGLYVRRRQIYRGVEWLGFHKLLGSATTFDFGNVYLGPPDPRREILIVAVSRNGATTNRNLSSGTLFDKAVTPATNANVGGTSVHCARVPAPAPAVMGPLSLTWSGSVADYVLAGLYRIVNRAAYDAGHSDTSNDSSSLSGTSLTCNSTTQKPNGIAVGVGGHQNANPNTVTGAVQLDTEFNTVGTTATWTWALCLPANVATTPSTVWSWSGSDANLGATWAYDFAT